MGMAMEGVDIAVLYPTTGLSLIARNNLDPQLSLALCRATNNWIHEFCQYSPERLKFVAMLPVHDAAPSLTRARGCVRELGAVGSFIRPNLVNGHYWHSNYWDPLLSLHEELDVTWGFHEGTGAWYSYFNELYGENRFYRHVASHWIEMQQALIAMIIGGVFEFHPKLRVGFLEAQNSWVPGLLSRIEWDYRSIGFARAVSLDDPARVFPAQLLGRQSRERGGDRGDRRPHRPRIGMWHLDGLSAFRLELPARVDESPEERAARDRGADLHGRRASLRVRRAPFPRAPAERRTGSCGGVAAGG